MEFLNMLKSRSGRNTHNDVFILCSFADIQEFYELTLLDDNKTIQQKTVETLQIASKWEHENSMKNNHSDVSILHGISAFPIASEMLFEPDMMCMMNSLNKIGRCICVDCPISHPLFFPGKRYGFFQQNNKQFLFFS